MNNIIEKTFQKWLDAPFPSYILEKVVTNGDECVLRILISSKDDEICFKFLTEISFDEVMKSLDTMKEEILEKSKKQRIQLFQLPQVYHECNPQWLRVGKFTVMYGAVEVRIKMSFYTDTDTDVSNKTTTIMTLTIQTDWTFEQLILALYDKYAEELSDYEFLQFYDHYKVEKFGTSGNISQFQHIFTYHYIHSCNIYKTNISLNADLLHSSLLPVLM